MWNRTASLRKLGSAWLGRRPSSPDLSRVGPARSGQGASVTFVFLLASVVPLYACTVPGSPVQANARLVFGVCAFAALGARIEQLLRLPRFAPVPAIFHRIMWGQLGLLTYFYVRSLLIHVLHLPSVSPIELSALVVGSLVWPRRGSVFEDAHEWLRSACASTSRMSPWVVPALLWSAWWASFVIYIGVRTIHLAPPSWDTEAHSYFAKLTLDAGRVVYDQSPRSSDPVTYPSAFAALNALWSALTGLHPATVVQSQVAIQGCLAGGLILDVVLSLRKRPALWTGLLLLAVAHFVFSLPVNEELPRLEGTSRQAHKAFAIWPATFAFILSAAPAVSRRALVAALGCISFGLAWALVVNPSHVFVELPASVMALGALLFCRSRAVGTESRVARWASRLAVHSVPLLFLLSDAWVHAQLFPKAAPPATAAHFGVGAKNVVDAFRAGWSDVFLDGLWGIVPEGCISTGSCKPAMAQARHYLPATAYSLALLTLGVSTLLAAARPVHRSPRRAPPPHRPLAVASVLILLLGMASLVDGWIWRSFRRLWPVALPELMPELLRRYVDDGMRVISAEIFLLLLGVGAALLVGFADRLLGARWGDGCCALAIAAVTSLLGSPVYPELAARYRRDVLSPPTAVAGDFTAQDLEFVRRAETLIPSEQRVLLPCILNLNPWEKWAIGFGMPRAIPLYTHTKFAFYGSQGGAQFDADAYQAHVCTRADLPWLASQGVSYLVVSDAALGAACIHAFPVLKTEYYDEILRTGDRVLYRMKAERMEQAASDPRLR